MAIGQQTVLSNSVAATGNGSITTQVASTEISNYKTFLGQYGLPYARSIPVVCEVTGMKPFTNLHAFVDNVNVDTNFYPCVQLTITNEANAKFLGYADVSPANTWSIVRDWDTVDFQGNLQALYPNGQWSHANLYTKGEVIRYYVSPTQFYSAIVIARQVQMNPTTRTMETVLHVALSQLNNTASSYTDNVTSRSWAAMPVNATIRGDISGATATVSAVSAFNANAMTIASGAAAKTNSLGNMYGTYLIGAGTVRTGDHEIAFSDSTTNDPNSSLTTSNAPFSSFGTLDAYNNTVVNRIDTFITTTVRQTVYTDPLAETFVIPAEKKDGCFVTSVDIYFQQKSATETQPVVCEICETLNGYPTQNILFNAVAQMSPDNIQTSTDGSVATRFRFQGPVFLEPGKEYCLKLLSNSVGYKVYVSQMGEASVTDPTKFVTAQPYLGTLFKSQNNSTWTPDQLQDLKFQLYYAKFDTSVSGVLTVHNQNNSTALASLPSNPFMVANTSTTCKVYFPNHGLFAGGFVTISGASASVFNNTFSVVSVVDTDHFLITLSAAQTFDGLTGGSTVKATKNIKYDSMIVDFGNYSLRNGTNITTTIKTSTASTKDAATTTLQPLESLDMVGARYIHSDLNEGLLLGNQKSLDVTVNLVSSTSDLSPMINRNTLSARLLSNKVNTPSTAQNTAVDNHTIASALAGVTFTATTGVIGIPVTQDINQYKIGANITISGTTSNNATHQIINIDRTTNPYQVFVSGTLVNESPATTTIVQAEGFVDEIAPLGGTAESKYQTIPISLANPATGLQIMFSANIPPAADVRLYYRTSMNTASKKIAETTWVAVPMSYRKSQGNEFLDQQYTVNAIPNFNVAQFKVVFVTTDTTKVAKLKDFRAICLA